LAAANVAAFFTQIQASSNPRGVGRGYRGRNGTRIKQNIQIHKRMAIVPRH